MTKVLAITPVWRDLPLVEAQQQAMLDASPVPVDWMREGRQAYPKPMIPGQTGNNRNIVVIYTAAVLRARRGGYTHLLCLEDDIIPPLDAIERLLEADSAIAYSLYCWRRTGHPWAAYRYLFPDSGESLMHADPWGAAAAFETQSIIDVAGVGNGCTLIDMAVFDRIEWRIPRGLTGYAQDWWLAVDAQQHKLSQRCHMAVSCGHMLDTERAVWPASQDGRASYEVRAL